MDPIDFLRLAVDQRRLAVLGLAAVGPVDVDAVATRLDIPLREAREIVGKLRVAGILDESFQLVRAVLEDIGANLARAESASEEVLDGPWTDEERTVLRTFFTGAKLTSIPMNRAKRRVVLELLAQEFEPGVRYSEREVSGRLQLFHPDYAALRRYMVDEQILTRADGVYWRSGGRYIT